MKVHKNEDFCNTCDWFVDNKISIHFGEDLTKWILFVSRFKNKNIKKIKIKRGYIQVKQHSKHLECLLDETISGEAVVLNVIIKLK